MANQQSDFFRLLMEMKAGDVAQLNLLTFVVIQLVNSGALDLDVLVEKLNEAIDRQKHRPTEAEKADLGFDTTRQAFRDLQNLMERAKARAEQAGRPHLELIEGGLTEDEDEQP